MNKQFIEKLDKRYKSTNLYLINQKGCPVYKHRAFPFIYKKLGSNNRWIHKTPEEYFGNDPLLIAKKCIIIMNYQKGQTYYDVKKTYYHMSIGNAQKSIHGWHPDHGGHSSAFAILNYAYNYLISLLKDFV